MEVCKYMEKDIYLKTLKLFASKGSRFTTEDLARELGTSKRTIYSYFSTKDEIIEKTIEFVFNEMITSDAEILGNNELTLQEKIKLYFNNIPDAYNLGSIIIHMDDLQQYYPYLWEKVNNYVDTSWDAVIKLIEQGIKNGELEEIDTVILKLMLNETLKKLLDYEFLAKSQISFDSALKAMNNIILYGLIKREDN
ncbi:TetR/AcrR family transcriptional regulator [Clostridium estertheticum]|uniref:TetR/AcrR family transcriptional regulator n=1 Tax=Clostridium estertheticum TaxID=238834 RepID=UPI001C0D55DD|nr:TetR/AcrR family transcriptional regulator [Clostridium estertheticum]MBU3074860.1 TetR/AcrR family transcriptional regulator [Clostridium estertheticum]MBU3165075.1 TetR/AcrR family transcriptional regulator [Clostridium estertheticum]